jgi:hypothetical protein
MAARRLRIAWIVLVGGMTPAILAYAAAMIRMRTATADAVAASSLPNPTKVDGALGPVETLVYLDPTWAGTAMIWIAGGIGLIVVLAISAATFMPRALAGREILRLRLASFVAGLPLAWPWISAALFR